MHQSKLFSFFTFYPIGLVGLQVDLATQALLTGSFLLNKSKNNNTYYHSGIKHKLFINF